ncbi:molecular chaperone TorD [Gordonibacter sp. 28C]|uniref:TorD/DmsD family molecular chaperone n=1 Tax=Gordonibacter sp. 28C TaxID=2078569 RepID=UPI000DF81ABA|nr:molecular chaperone TorD family protein [Gordonibacter sp. 28C]RDB62208.1 molecular chaperone TorD [Gordonibacter sp. 28C]
MTTVQGGALECADAPKRWELLAERLAFLGNSLLSPLTVETAFGLDEAFWDEFGAGLAACGEPVAAGAPVCDEATKRALARMKARVHDLRVASPEIDAAVRRANVEHARLFIGPPKPAAPPWETMYARSGEVGEVGFGRATVAMQDLLREAGLELAGGSNQYADHMGIELLYAAELCRRISAQASACEDPGSANRATAHVAGGSARDAVRDGAEGERCGAEARLRAFAREHPASWATAFRERVAESAPDGYYLGIVEVAEALCAAIGDSQ